MQRPPAVEPGKERQRRVKAPGPLSIFASALGGAIADQL
jgi:hypothetical protein